MNEGPKLLLVKSLAETLFWAKKCYYDGHQSVTDETYDKMEEGLKKLCPNHPILDCVGNPDFSYLFGMEATRSFCNPITDEDLLA